MIHRTRWLWVVLVTAFAVIEWLHRPSWIWVVAALVAVLAGGLLLPGGRRDRSSLAVTILLVLLAGAMSWAQLGLDTIDNDWPRERERRITSASRRLAGALEEALDGAERALSQAIPAAESGREEAFRQLAHALPPEGPEMGLALFEPSGALRAWAGRHRLEPRAAGDSVAVVTDGSYMVMETRRHAGNGRVIVASVLIWADSAIPGSQGSVAHRFREREGVSLAVYPPGRAPPGPDIFDYEQPTTAGPRVLFSVQPLPPEQGPAKESRQLIWSGIVTGLLLVLLAVTLFVPATEAGRYLVLLPVVWLALRAPPGASIGLGELFSPAVFFRPLLGPLSSSAGMLALSSTIVVLASIGLWRRGLPRRWWGVALGVALLLVAPYVIRELGRGITPPIDGVPLALWVMWELTLMVATAAMILPAAALFRGQRVPAKVPWTIHVGVVVAIVAAIAGIWVWNPHIGWPPWYTFLWTPSLLMVTLPAPRRATMVAIAIVAGSAAALVTWGAELEGRIDAARRDITSLGAEADPLVVPPLERLGERAATRPVPDSDTDLYMLWESSPLSGGAYPVRLDLWGPDGGMTDVHLVLDSLDVPAVLLSTMVRNLDTTDSREIVQVSRVPGIHSILMQRLDSGFVLTVAIGPRTRLIPPTELGRLLREPSRGAPLYSLALLPPEEGVTVAQDQVRWVREGWRVLGERDLDIDGAVRHAHAIVDLRGPVPVLIRGALVVLLNVGVMIGLWWLSNLLAGVPVNTHPWRRTMQSYQARLALTLSLFFLAPVAGFAAWSFSRLDDEAERGRDLLISQTLRDAAPRARGFTRGGMSGIDEVLTEVGRETGAPLALYSGGELVGSSSPILSDLGLVTPVLDPAAFRELGFEDVPEVIEPNSLTDNLVVGYRVVGPGPTGELGVIATPIRTGDPLQGARQGDLVLGLLLATLAGIAAALVGARRAARALARPVDDLRRLARALGRGDPVPVPVAPPPIEFEPVFAAFSRMAADVQSSQAALEAARRRTARVLATVATGVVALDRDGRVLLANQRARDILALPLAENDAFTSSLGAAWEELSEVIRLSLADPDIDEDDSHEFDANARRYGLQVAALGGDLRGIVLALTDLTDISRAERVLAWGEMARQVAHEIKNPLTPLRLGVQHLERIRRDRPAELDRVLQETSGRILAEIDRLDTIARAFSRFGAPAEDAGPLDPVDLGAVAAEVIQLYALAGEGTEVVLEDLGSEPVAARRDEVKEVLVNLLENSRNADSSRIVVRVEGRTLSVLDNGLGISESQLPHVFEPRFSTTTSGSGLGLAIVRRLVEGWGARIEVKSERGKGTEVEIGLRGMGNGE